MAEWDFADTPLLVLSLQGAVKLNDLLGLQTMATVNMALCQVQHRPHCPPSPQLEEQCGKVHRAFFCKKTTMHPLDGSTESMCDRPTSTS